MPFGRSELRPLKVEQEVRVSCSSSEFLDGELLGDRSEKSVNSTATSDVFRIGKFLLLVPVADTGGDGVGGWHHR